MSTWHMSKTLIAHRDRPHTLKAAMVAVVIMAAINELGLNKHSSGSKSVYGPRASVAIITAVIF